jgi:signal transduction histidine kinase
MRTLAVLRKQNVDSRLLAAVGQQVGLLAQQLDGLERIRSHAVENTMRVDLRSLAQDGVLAYAPVIKAAGVEVSIDGPPGVIVLADRGLVLQAMLHVVENALIAAAEMSHYRWVEIEVEAEPARIAIKDSGYGVQADRRDMIFDPFFSTRAGRDGLGLYFARTLMRSCGHDLVLSPDGDAFWLTFAHGE